MADATEMQYGQVCLYEDDHQLGFLREAMEAELKKLFPGKEAKWFDNKPYRNEPGTLAWKLRSSTPPLEK